MFIKDTFWRLLVADVKVRLSLLIPECAKLLMVRPFSTSAVGESESVLRTGRTRVWLRLRNDDGDDGGCRGYFTLYHISEM